MSAQSWVNPNKSDMSQPCFMIGLQQSHMIDIIKQNFTTKVEDPPNYKFVPDGESVEFKIVKKDSDSSFDFPTPEKDTEEEPEAEVTGRSP